ncbi:lactate racemase domain-containing protein [Georgenia daeguensis]|uniref:Lactate racemase domain-containing protein n=1 Tax=Georgenia daeguensis TaxID=908355 RepID=A0ABP8EQM4_9MICO
MTSTTVVPQELVEQASTIGGSDVVLTDEQVREHILASLARMDLDGRSVALVVPDGTRAVSMPLLMRSVHEALAGRATTVTVVIALGTHAAMSEEAIAAHLGFEPGRIEETYPGWRAVNHEWWKPETFADLGTIPAEEVARYSGGRLTDRPMHVVVNRAVVEHDVALVVGPVLPHEVVGMSGGNKYFFPGLSGHDVIDMSHWVGALISSYEIIGTRGITPVRALINAAADRIPSEKLCVAVVTEAGTDRLHSVSVGTTESAWEAAADIAADSHITYLEQPVKRVLSILPTMYDDIWTGAKGMYKIEPIVADGGEVIIYAPHITQISAMHPSLMKIGYHNRDYYVKQWDRFKDHPWGDLAHSTHLRGQGTYDAETGEEHNRVTVTLATSIPREEVEAVSLRWMDPADVDVDAMEADPEVMVVHNAGEVLFRLRDRS